MEFYPSVVSREESRVRFALGAARMAEHGYGFWPVEVIGGAPFIGMVGLSNPDFSAPFLPTVEIGWRLAAEHWGMGTRPRRRGPCWRTASSGWRCRRLCRSRPWPMSARAG